MSDPRFICPTCDATVYHMCHPPSYFSGRRLRRVDPEEIRAEHRERWAQSSPVVEAIEELLGDRALLDVEVDE